MGLRSGLSAEESVRAAETLFSGVPSVQRKCEGCLRRLERSERLSAALHAEELLPAAECRILEAGMRSGAAETASVQIAQRMEERAETALDELTGRVEPTVVILTSVMVGMILLSVMLPLLNILSAIG